MIGHDQHDSDEDAERGIAALGRHCQRDCQKGQHQHHDHLDQPEMKVGAGGAALLPIHRRVAIGASIDLGQGQLLQLIAPAPERVDRRQVDREVVTFERQGARRCEFGPLLDQSSALQAEDDRVRIIGRQELPFQSGGGDRHAGLVVQGGEDAVEMGAVIVAPVDADRHPLAELVEFPNLDCRTERA